MSTLELPEQTACEELSFSWDRQGCVRSCRRLSMMASKLQLLFDRMDYGRGEGNRVLWLAERG